MHIGQAQEVLGEVEAFNPSNAPFSEAGCRVSVSARSFNKPPAMPFRALICTCSSSKAIGLCVS